jgi:hypothetical protein
MARKVFDPSPALKLASDHKQWPVPVSSWKEHWWECARYSGPIVPQVEGRIAALLALWQTPIAPGWQRGVDPQLLKCRYRRGDKEKPHPGEHTIEAEVLADPLDQLSCFSGAVIDGINAVPLLADPDGGRLDNVEADLFLLVKNANETFAIYVVEVKDKDKNPWYALIENLLQLRLTQDSPAIRGLFQHRKTLPNPEVPLDFPPHGLVAAPLDLPRQGIVLAPPSYFEAPDQKRNAVAAARKLISAFQTHLAIATQFATWDADNRLIRELPTSEDA